jgi:cell division protein FtsN
VASRVAAKWATDGELSPGKNGVDLLLDFIPAKSTMVAYRYQKEVRIDALGNNFLEAFNQFLRYLVSPPMAKMDSGAGDANAVKAVAEALDREYGWYVTAEPGKSENVVADLVRTDIKLARLLFNPNLYPGLGVAPTPGKPVDVKPMIPPPPEKPAPETPPSKPTTPVETAPPPLASGSQPAPTASPPTPKAPPPRSFSQSMGAAVLYSSPRSPAQIPSKDPLPTTSPRRQEPATQRPLPATLQAQAHSSATSRGFKVQVFSSRSRLNAESVANQLESLGVKAEIEEVDLKERGIWFRIRLPGYMSRDSAKEAAEKVVSEGVVTQYWLVPRVLTSYR